MISAQPIPTPDDRPPVDTLKLAMLSILFWGPQPIYLSRHAELLREYQQEGLVETLDRIPRPAGASRQPHFFAQLTRAGQVLLSRPVGGVQ